MMSICKRKRRKRLKQPPRLLMQVLGKWVRRRSATSCSTLSRQWKWMPRATSCTKWWSRRSRKTTRSCCSPSRRGKTSSSASGSSTEPSPSCSCNSRNSCWLQPKWSTSWSPANTPKYWWPPASTAPFTCTTSRSPFLRNNLLECLSILNSLLSHWTPLCKVLT